jgi:hypothetical protein
MQPPWAGETSECDPITSTKANQWLKHHRQSMRHADGSGEAVPERGLNVGTMERRLG